MEEQMMVPIIVVAVLAGIGMIVSIFFEWRARMQQQQTASGSAAVTSMPVPQYQPQFVLQGPHGAMVLQQNGVPPGQAPAPAQYHAPQYAQATPSQQPHGSSQPSIY